MTPLYRIEAEGRDITATIVGRLVLLTVVDQRGLESDSFELHVDDSGDALAPPRKGAKIRIWLGYAETGLAFMGTFTVDEVEVTCFPHALRITGKAANLRDKIKSQKTRAHEGATLKSLFEKIARDNGLTASVDAEIGKTRVDYELQGEESDLHLMTRLAERHGAIAKIADGHLVVSKRGSGQSAGGKAMATHVITPQKVKKGLRGRLKDRSRYGSVSATWHDQAKAKRAPVKESQGEGPDYQLRQTFPSEAEARAACKAKLAELQRNEADLSFSTQGNPMMAAEGRLQLVGVSRKLDGDWIIKQARHTMRGSGGGFETQIEAETPGQRKDQKGKGK